MRNNINIVNNNQRFPYIIEYGKNTTSLCTWENELETHNTHNLIDGNSIVWCNDNNTIRLFKNNVEYYRDINDWYKTSKLVTNNQYIPEYVKTSNIKVYIPAHSISTYTKGIKYVVTANTWINGVKIDFGSFVFKPTETYAIPTGSIKNGNHEYFEYVDIDIIDPFYLMYSDEWVEFRNTVCGEPLNINNTGSSLFVSLYVVEDYDNMLMMKSDCIGGCTNFIIADAKDYLSLNLSTSLSPLGFKLDLTMNEEYDWFLNYLLETYNIIATHNDIRYDIVIKNKDSLIVGLDDNEIIDFVEDTPDRKIVKNVVTKYVNWSSLQDSNGIKTFFSSWETFELGWSLVASLTVYANDGTELLTIVSNELPITQDIFSMYTGGGAVKIIELNDMNINTYNVVNKVTNNIVQIERPNESKANVMQPVFFRVKDTEILTLHPNVTENISINLDNYKSKVNRFILQIEGCKFEQIGSNSYGILFKVHANKIPATAISGTYYILDDNFELVTTGKYNCVR